MYSRFSPVVGSITAFNWRASDLTSPVSSLMIAFKKYAGSSPGGGAGGVEAGS